MEGGWSLEIKFIAGHTAPATLAALPTNGVVGPLLIRWLWKGDFGWCRCEIRVGRVSFIGAVRLLHRRLSAAAATEAATRVIDLLTYENVSMCNIQHITPRVSHLTYPEWCTTKRFNLQYLLSVQIFTYETMLENIDLTNAKAVRRVHCNSRTYTKLFDIRKCVCIQRLTCECMSMSSF